MTTNKSFRAIPDLCTGCRLCELVCSLKKTGTINPCLARIRVFSSNDDGSSTPVICRHCKKPPCQQACPVPEAMYLDAETGAVVINDAECIGCLACMDACPFGAMRVGPEKEPLKCDLCDGDPVCVKYCPTRPEHQFPGLLYGQASALEYVEPHRVTRREPLAPSGERETAPK
ncbi:4Fe-4S dicluster domain-containing protein [Chloroflexota bacterium]